MNNFTTIARKNVSQIETLEFNQFEASTPSNGTTEFLKQIFPSEFNEEPTSSETITK